jgi:hypothetical protein
MLLDLRHLIAADTGATVVLLSWPEDGILHAVLGSEQLHASHLKANGAVPVVLFTDD